ncbi:hypothetical protein HNQ78_002520 [Phycisphaera mikurensis]|nr:hypothetical protein [Phycisphaera mikurensis]
METTKDAPTKREEIPRMERLPAASGFVEPPNRQSR